MTKKKNPADFIPRKKPELVGSTEKACEGCGKVIQREGRANMEWLRKRFCSTACNYRAISAEHWKRAARA